jgi:addiction module RelB/DinJ family antitoxin
MGYIASTGITAMGKSATVRARVEPELKRGAEAVLKKIGLTSSEAITLFLTQVKLTKGLPFPVRVPNKQTQRAIKDMHARKNVETFPSVSTWAKKARSL